MVRRSHGSDVSRDAVVAVVEALPREPLEGADEWTPEEALKRVNAMLDSSRIQGYQLLSRDYDVGTAGEYRLSALATILAGMTQAPECAVGPDALLLDIGSGIGRPSFTARLKFGFPRVIGVEIVAPQAAIAQWVADRHGVDGIEFRAGDVKTVGIPPAATHVYAFSQGFPAALVAWLATQLNAHTGWRVLATCHTPKQWDEAGLLFDDDRTITLTGLSMVGSGCRYAMYVLYPPPR